MAIEDKTNNIMDETKLKDIVGGITPIDEASAMFHPGQHVKMFNGWHFVITGVLDYFEEDRCIYHNSTISLLPSDYQELWHIGDSFVLSEKEIELV